jgi:pimeloyl-ACP methyl ester carboxylesterase
MRSILVLFLVTHCVVSAYSVGAAEAGTAVPAGTGTAIPATPAGDQLSWILSQLNGGAGALTEAELAAHLAPRFLAELSAAETLFLLQQTAASYAPITFSGFAYPPTPSGAIALVVAGTGELGALTITVENAPPYRITRLEFSEPPAAPSSTGQRVDIGGRMIFLDCVGTGQPTVLLEGGLVSDWTTVQHEVAGFSRVCAFDRPDSPAGHSDPTPIRTAQEVVDDLVALLNASGEPGPYLLVGHSMGGLYVQLYAYQHPDDVAGLVLVAPTPEEFGTKLIELIAKLGTPIPAASGEPNAEQISFEQMRQARQTQAMPRVTLVVLSHGRLPSADERPSGWPIEQEERLLRELHAQIAALAPNGRHVIVEDSGHDIHQEQPAVVVSGIRQVVEAVRDPATWGTPP